MNPELNQSFQAGEIAILDKDYANESEVKVVKQTTKRLYTEVESDKVRWHVMTYRLSKKTITKNSIKQLWEDQQKS